jgi:RNA polymerase sigma-70 factor, ECF subfamily
VPVRTRSTRRWTDSSSTQALARLSADHRVVIQRSYYQGWTTAQIAEDLQIPEGTAKPRLHYAMRALRLVLLEMGVTR